MYIVYPLLCTRKLSTGIKKYSKYFEYLMNISIVENYSSILYFLASSGVMTEYLKFGRLPSAIMN